MHNYSYITTLVPFRNNRTWTWAIQNYVFHKRLSIRINQSSPLHMRAPLGSCALTMFQLYVMA